MEASPADNSGQALPCESAGGSLFGMLFGVPLGMANSTSGTPCGANVCKPESRTKYGPRCVAGALARMFFGPGAGAVTLSICKYTIERPALTAMNTSHGPTLPTEGRITEGTMEARPSWSVTTWACDDPRRTGRALCPSKVSPSGGLCWPELARASVVSKVTVTPITGFAAREPSVTRITSG